MSCGDTAKTSDPLPHHRPMAPSSLWLLRLTMVHFQAQSHTHTSCGSSVTLEYWKALLIYRLSVGLELHEAMRMFVILNCQFETLLITQTAPPPNPYCYCHARNGQLRFAHVDVNCQQSTQLTFFNDVIIICLHVSV